MRDSRDWPNSLTPRRGFIAQLGGVAGVLVASMTGARRLPAQDLSNQPDTDWIKAIGGRHRTVFDVAAHRNGKPLAQAKNFLDAWENAFHVPEREVSLVVGIHGDAFPIVLADATWARFRIGELYEVADASTKSGAVRNVFTRAHAGEAAVVKVEQTVEALQQRGVRFIVCNNTIAGATDKLVAAGRGSADEIRSALLAGLLPGIRVVPAMVVALTQLQEAGLRYTKIA
jgi:intracellular sulfur oxidation DsrE/DsrF family protein